jgi:hypothetical protein
MWRSYCPTIKPGYRGVALSVSIWRNGTQPVWRR